MDKVELRFLRITYSHTHAGAYALILAEVVGDRRLPIIIGGVEAQAIAIQVENIKPARPLTHDLFKNMSDTLGIHLKEVRKAGGGVPLPEAELVVSAGRGMKGPENWGLVEELAKELGAATACSRPVADMHWRPHHEHVGQTGVAIRPNLYIAIGISGAIQHLAGVNQSKVICVINNDPEAPFFKAADYGIVGDAFQILPKLIEAAKKLNAER